MSLSPLAPPSSAPYSAVLSSAATAGSSAFISPESMVAYLQARLRHVDGQLRSLMDKQNESIRQSEALSELTGALDQCTSGGVQNVLNAEDLLRAYQQAIVRVGADTELGVALQAEQMKFACRVGMGPALVRVRELDIAGTPHGFWSSESGTGIVALQRESPNLSLPPLVTPLASENVRSFVDSVKRLREDVSNGSEMAMLAIQSLTSQRGVATQLATSILSAIADGAKQITQNVGR